MKKIYLMMSYRVMSPGGITFAFGESLNEVTLGLPKGDGKYDHIDLNILKEDIIVSNKLRETFGKDIKLILTSLSELSEDCYNMLTGKSTSDGKEEA